MTFRIEYAERILPKLIQHIKGDLMREGVTGIYKSPTWKSEIHVSGFWHFEIRYEEFDSHDRILITHKKRKGVAICIDNGVINWQTGIRRFDMLFAALNDELISKLKHDKLFKITKKKMNERYLTTSPYFWEKIDYYLYKKEIQQRLFELFGDEKYKRRVELISKGIEAFIEDKRSFIENTKKLALK